MKKCFLFRAAALGCAAALLCACQSAVTAGSAPASQAVAADASSSAGPTTLSIACTAAGVNPYLSNDAVTQQDATLLFEPLVAITPDMDLDYRIAQSIDNSATLVTVQIRSGCYFSDGTPVTAEDAAASIEAARASTLYGARLSNISEISVEGSAVCITLLAPDSLFAYLLDIPVLRAGETGLAKPTASGRYTYGESDTLIKNNRASITEQGGPDIIRLVSISGADELVSGQAVGDIDLYAMADNSTETSTINTVEAYYRSNDLVYIGVNDTAANPLCGTPEGRRLLSALTGRNDLSQKAYSARGYAATGVINSFYPCVKGRQTILASADASALESTMAGFGYTRDAESGYYQKAGGAEAAVSLLVYGGNSYRRYTAQLLQEQWQANGIRVDITEAANFEDYLSAVQSGQFELYIGEVKLYNNIDLSPFWSGQASSGLAFSEPLTAAYAAFRQNAGTAGDFEAAFAAEMPFIPLLWHSGTVVTGRRVSGVNASITSAFYSLSGLTIH